MSGTAIKISFDNVAHQNRSFEVAVKIDKLSIHSAVVKSDSSS